MKDGVLSDEEMSELAIICKRFGLTSKQLSSISVPDKNEILRAALASIKARGEICGDDREHIRSLVHYLNARTLLKPCLMDLDLYEHLFALRRGELPCLDAGNLILDVGEHLHYKAGVTYEVSSGGKVRRTKGMLFVGSFKLRFVGTKKSHELRYKNILEISFVNARSPKLILNVSSGKGSGAYRLSKENCPAALLELRELIQFLILKAKRMLQPAGRAPSYIPDEVRNEVWYRDGGACKLCGAREYLEMDHVIPRSKGGDTSVGNLQVLCRRCNAEKGDRI